MNANTELLVVGGLAVVGVGGYFLWKSLQNNNSNSNSSYTNTLQQQIAQLQQQLSNAQSQGSQSGDSSTVQQLQQQIAALQQQLAQTQTGSGNTGGGYTGGGSSSGGTPTVGGSGSTIYATGPLSYIPAAIPQSNYPQITAYLDGRTFAAIEVNVPPKYPFSTFLLYTVLDELGLSYSFQGNGVFQLSSGGYIRGVAQNGTTYIPWSEVPGLKVTFENINGGSHPVFSH